MRRSEGAAQRRTRCYIGARCSWRSPALLWSSLGVPHDEPGAQITTPRMRRVEFDDLRRGSATIIAERGEIDFQGLKLP